MRKGNARNGNARAGRNLSCFNNIYRYSGVEDCESQEIMGQSSLSATKVPQYERVINGLGLMSLVDF